MHNLGLALDGAWKVLAAGLILGAGLPALFGLGIRALAYGAGGDAEEHAPSVRGPAAHPLGTMVGWLLFAIVFLGVAVGITFIVAGGFGKALSFEHVFPTLVDK